MKDDKRHLQLRIGADLRNELESLSAKYGISTADAVRGILFFGIPVFDTLTQLSHELVKKLVENLKKEARAVNKKRDREQAIPAKLS
jgi:antitoxin component of RelBE/YafQ-DinJ toxin-antitoxin module